VCTNPLRCRLWAAGGLKGFFVVAYLAAVVGAVPLRASASNVNEKPAIETMLNLDASAATQLTSMTMDSGGNLYGVAAGVVYEIATTQDGHVSMMSPLARIPWKEDDFWGNAIFVDSNGNLFVTDSVGDCTMTGNAACGAVLMIAKSADGYAANATTLAKFQDADGNLPFTLTIDGAGNLFGATRSGGRSGRGTVIEIAKGAAGYAPKPVDLFDLPDFRDKTPTKWIGNAVGNLVMDPEATFSAKRARAQATRTATAAPYTRSRKPETAMRRLRRF
jgi:hypothetical protein